MLFERKGEFGSYFIDRQDPHFCKAWGVDVVLEEAESATESG